MDLKQFATLQKIQGKSELLRYVISHSDVPVEELEKAFGGLIENEKSPVVDALSDNYGAFLQKQTRLGVVPLANNSFEVSGDIDTNLIEAIELISGDSREDIVNNLVFTIMSEIRGSHDLEISDIQLTENELNSAVTKVLDKAEEAIALFKSSDLKPVESNDDKLEDSNDETHEDSEDKTLESANEDTLKESTEDKLEESDELEESDDELVDSNEDELVDSNEDELVDSNEDELVDSNEDELEESNDELEKSDEHVTGDAEKDIQDINFDELAGNVDFGNSINEPEVGGEPVVDEATETVDDEAAEKARTAKVVKRIYDKVVDNLKERHLDERLGLDI